MTPAEEVLGLSPVIPVVTVEGADQAVPLARALLEGGVGVVEITLRTPGALAAAEAIVRGVPEMTVGVGTVLTPSQADAAADAGAHFVVTPGTTPDLLRHLAVNGFSALPGASTASEVLVAREQGFLAQKLFPASVGGPAHLSALGAPVPDVVFCPTGGITAETAPDYLALPNVACVGGSWLTPAEAVRAGDWQRITRLASQVAQIAQISQAPPPGGDVAR